MAGNERKLGVAYIVNQRGKIYQKNLGERTADLATEINEYNPDETWKPAEGE
jgi:hypothetical protein